jgi:Protein of unknown function (DUF3617)
MALVSGEHMNVRTAAAALVLAGSASLLMIAQAPRMDGRWDVTMETEMVGMPGKMPPAQVTECLTKEEAADPEKALAQRSAGRGVGSECKISNYKVAGNKVTWTVKCAGNQQMTGTGERIYGADSYTATTKLDMGGMQMTMKSKGKRVGDCIK